MCQQKEIQMTEYSDGALYTLMYQAEQEGAFACHVRGKICPTVDDFFREISSAMRFPYYFGFNWAAFDECLTDLEWLKFSRILIVIDHFELLFLAEKSRDNDLKCLVKYLNIAVDYWKGQNIPISVFLNK